MEKKEKMILKQPDYKKIREEGQYIDCTITEADFDTNCPNTYRIDYTVRDILRHLKFKNGGEKI